MRTNIQTITLLDHAGGIRTDLPASHPDFPARQSPDMLNIMLSEGVSRKWPGRLPYSPLALSSSRVRWLADYRVDPSARYLIASDGADLVKHTAGPPESWDYLTPTYTTGTATITADSVEVTGVDTAWTAALEGKPIKLDADGWIAGCVVEEVVSETHLHLATAYTGTGGGPGAYTIRQQLTSNGEKWLRGCVGSGDLILVNGADSPLLWDGLGDTFVPLGGSPPVARFASTFHSQNVLVLANLGTDSQMVHLSAPGNYADWSGGHTYSFHNVAGAITGLDGTHEYLFMWMEKGVWRGEWTGTDVKMYWTQAPGINGNLAANSLVRLGGQSRVSLEDQPAPLTKWGYWGQGNIYAFDGERIWSIGDSVRRWISDRLDPAGLDLVQGVVVPDLAIVIWSFPEKGATENTHSVALNYDSGEWMVADRGYQAFGAYDLNSPDPTWDSLTGTVDNQSRIFDMTGSLPEPVTLCGDSAGYVHYLAKGANDNGAAITARRQTRTYSWGQGRAVEVGRVVLTTTARPGSRISVTLLAGDNPQALSPVAVRSAIVSETSSVEVGFLHAGRHFAFEIVSGELTGELGLVGISVDVRGRGW